MPHYDAVVVGGGTGNNTAFAAAERGNDVALIEEGPLGGTCLNRGCNPSKMLIAHANAANAVREAGRFDVDASLEGIAYADIVEGISTQLADIADSMERSQFTENENVTVYHERAEFVDERTLAVDGTQVSGDTVVVAAGTRPWEPSFIDGIEEVEYLTSREAIRLTERPDSMVVVGGGYIAVELGYFFESMGVPVTIIEMEDRLVPREDPDVAAAFTEIARERHDVYTGYAVDELRETGDGGVVVGAEDGEGDRVELEAGEALLALGRVPNTDTLNVEAAGIETDENGFVRTDEYLATTAENVWAQGDIAGNYLFKHTGDYETDVVVANAFDGAREPVDYTGVGHAIYTEPQMAAAGAAESELGRRGEDYVVGRADYADQPMARAKKIDEGFVKVLADADTGELLGAHLIGENASDYVHHAVVAIRTGGTVEDLAGSIYVHPALSKVVRAACADAAASV